MNLYCIHVYAPLIICTDHGKTMQKYNNLSMTDKMAAAAIALSKWLKRDQIPPLLTSMVQTVLSHPSISNKVKC